MISVLLSTYNGEKFLAEQIDSLLSQTVKTNIVVRDDGSKDNTINILRNYSDAISLYEGKNLGFALSFWELLSLAPKSDYYAFCDQDDVWDNDKVEKAINMLKQNDDNIPLLYCCNVRLVDEDLILLKSSSNNISSTSFATSLFTGISQGCTFVFNDIACQILKEYCGLEIDYHDWMAFRIISCFGKVIFDKEAHMSYRQHANNCVGRKQSDFTNKMRYLKYILCGESKHTRSTMAGNLLKQYKDKMPKENVAIASNFANYRKNIKSKIYLLKMKKLNLSRWNKLYFRLIVLFNKL